MIPSVDFIKREQIHDKIFSDAQIGLWELFACDGGLKIRFDEVMSGVLGFPAGELLDFSVLTDIIFPEDTKYLMNKLQLLVLGESLFETLEYRAWDIKTEKYKWVRSFGHYYGKTSSGMHYIVGASYDLENSIAFRTIIGQISEANERAQIMLDATPLACNFWDKNYKNIDCNLEAVKLFDLKNKQEYLDNFFDLSPEYQPCGKLSSEKAVECIEKAFRNGRYVFDWIHRKLNGELIPCEITLVRVTREKDYIVLGYTRDLREHRKMIKEMREAEERTQIMLDATPLACNLWDKNFNNIDCNEEACKLFELGSKKEYLRRFFELSPKYQPCGRLSTEMAQENIKRAFDTGRFTFEWMHQKLNGEPVPSEITLVRVERDDGYIVAGYTRDLREYKKMMAEMREADERTKIMLDATPLCCNLWDENFNNIDCNEEAVKLFDLDSKQNYLDRFFELSPEYQPCGRPTAEMAHENIKKAFAEGRCVFEWMHQKLNGEPIPSEITLVRVKRGDKFIVAGYTRDLREYKRMMSEVRQVENDLRLARDAAEESARSKSEFLANMSHEIRTPMNAILGLMHIVQKTALSDEQSEYVTRAENSAKILLRVINDILDFSKIEAGKLDMELVEFSVDDVMQQLSDMFSERIKEKNLELIISIEDNLPKRLIGDPLRLQQVLLNLAGNSVKFTENGSITISAATVQRTADKIRLEFSVKDTGIGMTPTQVKKLFEPFSQADASTTRKYGGSGLGLAICKRLVNLMDGEIECESELGIGTSFRLTAEFDIAHEMPALPDDANSRDLSENYDISELKPILVAEDNEINRLIAEELLKAKGYKVNLASTGEEAVEMIKANDYELVLMDIQMPVMDGLTATSRIRELDEYKNLVIIAMTAHAMSGDREKSIKAGMNDHITKPIDPPLLYSMLRKWIKR